MHAAVAQSVERRLGKAEVGGSIPLGSLIFRGLQEITSSESLFASKEAEAYKNIVTKEEEYEKIWRRNLTAIGALLAVLALLTIQMAVKDTMTWGGDSTIWLIEILLFAVPL